MILGIITAIILFSLSLVIKTDTTHFNNFQNNNFPVGKTINPLLEQSFSYDLVPHAPINITNNDNFTDYGFDGTGADGDPYIIEGYNITTPSGNGIYIESTTMYFVIRNCYTDANNSGIFIENVAEGTATINNNTCTHNDVGIHLDSSFGCTLANNTCTHNNNEGIYLWSSSGCTLINNTCINNNGWVGIYLDSSSGSTLTKNTCTNNGWEGIYLASSPGSTLTKNTCTNNDVGIHLWSSSGSTLINNSCTNNNIGIYLDSSSGSTPTKNTCSNNNIGIYLIYSKFCLITYNLLKENEGYGISIIECESTDNIIHHNTFVDNNLDGTSQAYDSGVENIWYDSTYYEGNHWSDLGNYCYYQIDGEGGAKDLYPLNAVENCINPPPITTDGEEPPDNSTNDDGTNGDGFPRWAKIFLSIVGGLVLASITAFVFVGRRKPQPTPQPTPQPIQQIVVQTCNNCGYEVPQEFAFCPECGQTLAQETT